MADKGKIKKPSAIVNRKARYEYEFIETFSAGIVLRGTEVKSLRQGKANLQEAYAYVDNDEVFIKGMNIAEYDKGNIHNHDPVRIRKLLLKKKEIAKLRKGLEQQGNTIVPFKIYFNDRNFIKMEIALAKGKKLFDKRDSLKEKDTKREINRQMRM
ncbi:MAG: SsrA-binding protein SmpB [Bacteroidota bacterium]